MTDAQTESHEEQHTSAQYTNAQGTSCEMASGVAVALIRPEGLASSAGCGAPV